MKVFLISYVWASICTILPVIIQANIHVTGYTITVFTAHFLFIMAITLPFDIRDYKTDNQNLLITIPQFIGINLTKVLSIVCLAIFYILMQPYVFPVYLAVVCLITAGLILYSSPRRKYYYFTFYIDGTIILYYIAIQLSI